MVATFDMSVGPLRSVKEEGEIEEVEVWQDEKEAGVVQGWTILGWVTGRLGATGMGSSLGWRAALLLTLLLSREPNTSAFTFLDLLFSWFSSSSPPL